MPGSNNSNHDLKMFWFCLKSTLNDDINEQPVVQEEQSLGSNQWIQAWMTNKSTSNSVAKTWTKEIFRSMDSSPSKAELASGDINSQMIEMIAIPLHGTKFLSKRIINQGKFVGVTKRDEILNSLSKSPKVKTTREPFPHYLDCRDLHASESTERVSYHRSPLTTRESTFDEIYGCSTNDEFHLINDILVNSEHTSTIETSTDMHTERMSDRNDSLRIDVLRSEALRAYEDALSQTSPTFLPSVYRGEFYGSTFRKQL